MDGNMSWKRTEVCHDLMSMTIDSLGSQEIIQKQSLDMCSWKLCHSTATCRSKKE